MSIEAINWAISMPVARSSAKFVLVAMANCADAEMLCWPSIKYLTDATSQDRKTVLENVKRLIDEGYITATEKRSGSTRQVVVYKLNSPKNGTVQTVPFFPPNSPVFPMKQSRFSVETVPKTGHGTIKEPNTNTKTKSARASVPASVTASVLVEAGFDEPTAAEFIAHKCRVKAPLTERAWRDHLAESRKAGWSPQAAAEKVMAKTWKGFEAKYVASEARPGADGETARERHTRERVRQMTGGILGNKPAPMPSWVEAEIIERIA